MERNKLAEKFEKYIKENKKMKPIEAIIRIV